MHDGHQPRPLREKATNLALSQLLQLTSVKPNLTSPHSRERAPSFLTRVGMVAETCGQPRRNASCKHGVGVLRILTDRGSEYCGNSERHGYALYLDFKEY